MHFVEINEKVIRTRKYRLYPNKCQKEKLEQTLEICRQLYNAALEERKEAYRMQKVGVSFYQQQKELTECRKEFPELAGINRRVQVDASRRLDKAFQGFFRRVKSSQKAGYPRFRSKNRYNSFAYTGNFDIYTRKLYLFRIGVIRCRPDARQLLGDIKQCQIMLSNDKWYAVLCCAIDNVEKKKISSAIGIDLGTKDFATLSNGEKIGNPRLFDMSYKVLRRKHKNLSKKKKGSINRLKARKILSKQYECLGNQRYDFCHKISKQLIDRFDLIVYEDLQIDRMTKNSYYAKNINDASWRRFTQMLDYKAEDAGKWAVPVNPAYTSQTCSACGSIGLIFTDRNAVCKDCGLVMDRDYNAAKNILRLGTSLCGEKGYFLEEARSESSS